ncbi:hypothetical protein, conserved [Eimeria acervulina]|uniref:Uncharacterized protein n=1 Tax=Eimeria acervulina TaxID=5801 RepID=U6GCQ9_EIMAC|nr:hypothetical protein, conserved [Eimeria acervulina]CDI77935.1 hypothetical protein, conserved [Eimeria acervulina]
MRYWLAFAAVCIAGGVLPCGFGFDSFAAAAEGPSVAVYDQDADSDVSIFAEPSADLQWQTEGTVTVSSNEGGGAAAAETACRPTREKHKEDQGQIEAAPTAAPSVPGATATAESPAAETPSAEVAAEVAAAEVEATEVAAAEAEATEVAAAEAAAAEAAAAEAAAAEAAAPEAAAPEAAAREAAAPEAAAAEAAAPAPAAAAAGSGARMKQEQVGDDLHSVVRDHSGSNSGMKKSGSRQRGLGGNSSRLRSGGGVFEGGGDGQSLLLLERDPLSPFLSLPKAPRMVGSKSFIFGLGLLFLAAWIGLEGDDTVVLGPAHFLTGVGDLDREDISAICSTLLAFLGTVSLFSAVYRHLKRVRQQREWIRKAEEGIDAARKLHESRLKKRLAREQAAGVVATDVGKPG